MGAAALNQYRLLLAWIIITILFGVFYSILPIELFKKPVAYQYVFLGLSGIVGFTIGDYFSFTSFKLLGPKLGSLYTTVAPGAALFFGYLILGETMNVWGILGVFITIIGVIWLTLSRKDKVAAENAGFIRSKKGIVFGVAGALCQGTGLVLSKVALNYSGGEHLATMHAVWIRLLFAFSAAFVVSFLSGRLVKNSVPVFTNQNNGLPYLVAGTVFGPVMGVTCSLLAIQSMPVAGAQTIFALLPIVVLPINYFYYKEKITIQAIMACAVAFAGVVLLTYREVLP
ncbi:MAG: DMT family transporter [Bacteroidia bacterium]|nr:DMT family transporter [Bacteroidia bacterium]